jgi:hypothetical protein
VVEANDVRAVHRDNISGLSDPVQKYVSKPGYRNRALAVNFVESTYGEVVSSPTVALSVHREVNLVPLVST